MKVTAENCNNNGHNMFEFNNENMTTSDYSYNNNILASCVNYHLMSKNKNQDVSPI